MSKYRHTLGLSLAACQRNAKETSGSHDSTPTRKPETQKTEASGAVRTESKWEFTTAQGRADGTAALQSRVLAW